MEDKNVLDNEHALLRCKYFLNQRFIYLLLFLFYLIGKV